MNIEGITHRDKDIILALLDREIAKHDLSKCLGGNTYDDNEVIRVLCVLRSKVFGAGNEPVRNSSHV